MNKVCIMHLIYFIYVKNISWEIIRVEEIESESETARRIKFTSHTDHWKYGRGKEPFIDGRKVQKPINQANQY